MGNCYYIYLSIKIVWVGQFPNTFYEIFGSCLNSAGAVDYFLAFLLSYFLFFSAIYASQLSICLTVG